MNRIIFISTFPVMTTIENISIFQSKHMNISVGYMSSIFTKVGNMKLYVACHRTLV